MKKRIISLLLAFVLCLSLLPGAALADEGGTPTASAAATPQKVTTPVIQR